MNTPLDAVPGAAVDPRGATPPAMPAIRPLYWSVRRELWENRSIYIAPLAVAAVALFGCLINAMTLPFRVNSVLDLDPVKQHEAIAGPYHIVAGLVLVTAFIVGVFYCLDALHGERRDRSILFWKSLPVSDRTTVLSKAAIPLVVMPLLVFAIVVPAHWVMLMLSTVFLLGNLHGIGALWAHVAFPQMAVALLYALLAIALWHAPIYAWLLLVSAWSRRAAFLWAVLPLLAICVFEMMAFRTSHFASLIGYRVVGWFTLAFAPETVDSTMDPLKSLTPGDYLGAAGLWFGLAFAAAFIAAAVRLRRNREPL